MDLKQRSSGNGAMHDLILCTPSLCDEYSEHSTSSLQNTNRQEHSSPPPITNSIDRFFSNKVFLRKVTLKVWLGIAALSVVTSHQAWQATDASHDGITTGLFREATLVSVPNAVIVENTDRKSQLAPDAAPPAPPRRKQQLVLYGKHLTSALYRFEASRLGPDYAAAVAKFEQYYITTVDPDGAKFAAQQTRKPGPHEFHQGCFRMPDENKLLQLEYKKKNRHHRSISKDGTTATRIQSLQQEQEIFFGRKECKNCTATTITTMITKDAKLAWRAAASFSAQHAGRQHEFREQVMKDLGTDDWNGTYFGGKVSGTFWYPPNAIREWHTNAWDVKVDSETREPRKPWRMYYVRQKAASTDGGLHTSHSVADDPEFFKDKSAMHIVDGPGIPPERMKEFGAYRLMDNSSDGHQTQLQTMTTEDPACGEYQIKMGMFHCFDCKSINPTDGTVL